MSDSPIMTPPAAELTVSASPALEGPIPAPPELPRLTGRGKLGLLLTVALIAVGWSNTFAEMWLRWFPAWYAKGYTLTQRLTEGDSYYTHGPMVPLASLIMAAMIYRRVGAPARRTRLDGVLGGVLFAGSLLLHLASVSRSVTFVSGFALIGVLVGLLLLWGGRPLLRAYWLPVAFLAFMVPLPMDWIAKLNFQLKFAAGRAAEWLCNHLFSVPVFMDGSYVFLAPAPDGTPKMLVVENVCGGLRSMISLICFASLFAMICRTKGGWRLFMLAMAVPVAIACNIVRITSLNLVAHYFSVEAAGPESWFHGFSGLAVFAVALAFLFGLEQVILWAGKRFKRNWSDERLLGFLDHLPRGGVSANPARPVTLSCLAIVAALSVWLSIQPAQLTPANEIARGAVPTELRVGDAVYTYQDLELDQKTLAILETNDYLYRRFREPAGEGMVDLLIVFSQNNRKGTHPPEVCLEGGGEQVVSKTLQAVPLPRVGEISFRELVTMKGPRRTYHIYAYKAGKAYTPSFLSQQFQIVWNGLSGGNTAGAIIRFSVAVEGEGVESARTLALSAAAALMPAMDERMP